MSGRYEGGNKRSKLNYDKRLKTINSWKHKELEKRDNEHDKMVEDFFQGQKFIELLLEKDKEH